MNTQPSRLNNILVGLIVSLGILLGIESMARVGMTLAQDLAQARKNGSSSLQEWEARQRERYDYSPTLGWERHPGYRGTISDIDPYERHFDEQGYFVADSKQVDVQTKKRIIFLGDSNTFGWGVSTESSFVEVVESLLPDVYAINLGVPGYTSYQGRVSFDKFVPIIKPDLIVVAFNFNDRRYVLPPNREDSAEQFQSVYDAGRITASEPHTDRFEISYLFRAMRLAMRTVGIIPRPAPELTEVRTDMLKPRVNEEAYRRNLTHIAEESGRLGIPLLFVLLRDNPIESYHLKQGIENMATSPDMAISHLEVASESSNMFSDLARIYLAKAYEARGDTKKANEVVITQKLNRETSGGSPIRLDTTYHDIMRQVALDHEVEVADAGKVLDEHPSDYIDASHFDADGHRRVGQLLASAISRLFSSRKEGRDTISR